MTMCFAVNANMDSRDASDQHCMTNHGSIFLIIFGWGCAAWTMEPLAYTRAGSAEFCYQTPQIPPI